MWRLLIRKSHGSDAPDGTSGSRFAHRHGRDPTPCRSQLPSSKKLIFRFKSSDLTPARGGRNHAGVTAGMAEGYRTFLQSNRNRPDY